MVPPEVAALYSSRPSTIPPPSSSSLPHSSSVNIDDVFAALDRRDRKAANRPNLDDYYADPPSEVNYWSFPYPLFLAMKYVNSILPQTWVLSMLLPYLSFWMDKRLFRCSLIQQSRVDHKLTAKRRIEKGERKRKEREEVKRGNSLSRPLFYDVEHAWKHFLLHSKQIDSRIHLQIFQFGCLTWESYATTRRKLVD